MELIKYVCFMTEVPIYRNQSINLLCKSMDQFLYDRDFRYKRFNPSQTNVTFLQPLKTSRNLKFFYVLRGFRKGALTISGLKKLALFKSIVHLADFKWGNSDSFNFTHCASRNLKKLTRINFKTQIANRVASFNAQLYFSGFCMRCAHFL